MRTSMHQVVLTLAGLALWGTSVSAQQSRESFQIADPLQSVSSSAQSVENLAAALRAKTAAMSIPVEAQRSETIQLRPPTVPVSTGRFQQSYEQAQTMATTQSQTLQPEPYVLRDLTRERMPQDMDFETQGRMQTDTFSFNRNNGITGMAVAIPAQSSSFNAGQPISSILINPDQFWNRKSQPMTHVGNQNLFGISADCACDEWANYCGCCGLKAQPGHLGLPWLRGNDPCECVDGCRRRGRQGAGCGSGCGNGSRSGCGNGTACEQNR